jgi:hypothetical protein
MLKYLYIVLVLALGNTLYAQDGVNGQICSQNNGELILIGGANIYVEELGLEFFSDENGNFQIENLDASSSYHITITALGYEDVEMVLSGSEFHTLISLEESSGDLPFLTSETAHRP